MPTGKEAYLYGRFFIQAERTVFAGGTQGMGFSISCEDGAKYVIGFSGEEPLNVIKVAPSACLLNEVVYSSDGMFLSAERAPASLLHGLRVAPGKAYYLDDFSVKTSQTKTSGILDRTWHLDDVKDNYNATTSRMKRTFVNLARVPTEDQTIGGKDTDSKVQP